MNARRDAAYRLRLAAQHLDAARRARDAGLHPDCLGHAQAAAENYAKAMLAELGPIARTHEPAVDLAKALDARTLALPAGCDRRGFLEPFSRLGMREHIRATYGDERAGLTPEELITALEAAAALGIAEECGRLAMAVVGGTSSE